MFADLPRLSWSWETVRPEKRNFRFPVTRPEHLKNGNLLRAVAWQECRSVGVIGKKPEVTRVRSAPESYG